MSKPSYPVPAAVQTAELLVRKSRFIARAGPAATRADAMVLVDDARRLYPDARHHCWAYVLGSPVSPSSAAMSDDGEPSGTAGKPILNVLQHKDVGDIALVVTRYFGGIKLGAGGLVRAYSAAAQAAIDSLELSVYVAQTELSIVLGFDQEQHLRYWLGQADGQLISADYTHQVTCRVSFPVAERDAFTALCDERAWLIVTD